jgi:hypothetical protein
MLLWSSWCFCDCMQYVLPSPQAQPVSGLVANSLAYEWEVVFVASKTILVQARPPGSAPGLQSFWRTSRRSDIQGLGASNCKRPITRDRRNSKQGISQRRSVVGPFDRYLNWPLSGVYKSSVLQSDVPRPCSRIAHTSCAESQTEDRLSPATQIQTL